MLCPFENGPRVQIDALIEQVLVSKGVPVLTGTVVSPPQRLGKRELRKAENPCPHRPEAGLGLLKAGLCYKSSVPREGGRRLEPQLSH